MRTVLFLAARFPWPLVGGDRVKPYFLLKHLARNNRVILVTFNHGGRNTPDYEQAMREIGVELHAVHLNPIIAGLACIRSLWNGMPLEIAFYTRPAFQKKVDEVLASTKVDVVFSFFMRAAEYIRYNGTYNKVLIAEDCRVQYMKRSHAAANTFLEKIVRWWELRQLKVYEPAVAADFDVTTFVSPEDVAAMLDQAPSIKCRVVTNGVNMDRFTFVDDHEHRSGVVLTGKMDVLANHIMGMHLVQNILPGIRAVLPDVHFTIAGSPSRKQLAEYRSNLNTMHDGVPEVIPFLHSGALYIHPHKGASGIQNKLLEAMATGIAIVTTPSGVQGIEAVHNVHCMIAHNDAEIIEYSVELLRNPQKRSLLATNARQLMMETHSWAVVDRQIDDVIEEVTK